VVDISYLGGGSVKVSGRNLSVVSDPINPKQLKADVVLLTSIANEDGQNDVEYPAGTIVIDRPGQYEVKGATITGVPARLHIDESGDRGTVYSVGVENTNTVVTGNIAGSLAKDEIEGLGRIDALVVPVGGGGLTLDAQGAAEVVAQLEPNYVVPVHYDDGVTKYSVPQAGVDLFLKEMGVSPEPEAKLRLTQKEDPSETQVVLLNRAGS
jgi:L-ascorbate metabolism protein UlaG (beta-lactamase superfamily)